MSVRPEDRHALGQAMRSKLGLTNSGSQNVYGPKCPGCGYYGRFPDPEKCRICEHRKAQDAWLESDDPEAVAIREGRERYALGQETLAEQEMLQAG